MNKVILVGNLGKDPEKKSANGKSVAKFSLAIRGKKKDDAPTWLNVVAWEKLADVVTDYLKKGSKVLVEGRITVREHEGKYYTDIVAENIEFLDPKPTESKPKPRSEEIDDSDLPF